MQTANESCDSSPCSTNELRDVCGKELYFKAASHPYAASPLKELSSPKGEVLADASSSAEIEEGEIKDDSSSVEFCEVLNSPPRCQFFEKGRCSFGEKCKLLHHQQTDNGLNRSVFNRLAPHSITCIGRPRLLPSKAQTLDVSVEEIDPDDNDDWDLELKEAMLRVGIPRKKVPFDELNLTIRTSRVLPASPTTENRTFFDRRVRYPNDEEPKQDNTRSREKASQKSLKKSSRKRKRRHSETFTISSRSPSSTRRRSCKCCRTPSPKHGRRPICCYRRKRNISSSSSSSSSSMFRRRAMKRRARDKDTRRKLHRDRSCKRNSPDKSNIWLYIRDAKASFKRRLGGESHTSKTRRDNSKIRSLKSPKGSKFKSSSDKSFSPSSCSPAKVDKLTASCSTNKRTSDMSISSSESGTTDNLSSNRSPSDMSISPYSDLNSPRRFPTWRVVGPTIGVASAQSPKTDAPKKRIKIDFVKRPPSGVLPPVPIFKSCLTAKRLRSEVPEPKHSSGSREAPKSVGIVYLKKRSGVAGPSTPAVQPEVPRSERSTREEKFKNYVAEPKSFAVAQNIPKSMGSNFKKKLNDFMKLSDELMRYNAVSKPPAVSRERLKSDCSTPKKKPENDVARQKSPAVPPEIRKDGPSTPKKYLENDSARQKSPAVPKDIRKYGPSTPKKKFENEAARPKPTAVPKDTRKSERPTPKKKPENHAAWRKSSAVSQDTQRSGRFTPKRKSEKDIAGPKPTAIPQDTVKSGRSTPKKKPKNDVAGSKLPVVPREMAKSSCAPNKRFNHLLSDLMKFHKNKDGPAKAEKATTHPQELGDVPVAKVLQKSAPTLSRKDLLTKQLKEVEAAIERAAIERVRLHLMKQKL